MAESSVAIEPNSDDSHHIISNNDNATTQSVDSTITLHDDTHATSVGTPVVSSSPQVVVEHHWLTPTPHARSVGSIAAAAATTLSSTSSLTPSLSSSVLASSSSSSGGAIIRSGSMGNSGSIGAMVASSSIKAIPQVESLALRFDGLTPAERARRLIDQCLQSAADGVPLQHVSITTTSRVGDVVFYEVIISNDNIRWTVLRRFNEFVELNTMIEARVRVAWGLPPFPDKHWKMFTDHLDADFINVRRSILENYLKKILLIPKLRCCRPFLQFLTPAVTDEVKTLDFKDELFEPRDFDGLERDRKSSVTRDMVAAAVAYNNTRAHTSSVSAAISSDDSPPSGITSSSSSSSSDGSPVRRSLLATPNDTIDVSSSSSSSPPSLSSSTAAISGVPIVVAGSVVASSSDSKDAALLSASTEVTEVSIPAAQILKRNHVAYQINVFNIHKRKTYSQWTVLKRYIEFYKLDAVIRAALTLANDGSVERLPTLPTRQLKMFVDHLQTRFIEKRRLILQVYLTKLITVPEAVARPELLEFLGCNS